MCTVTFIARKNGYALGMNRDEKLTRVAGLPPRQHDMNGRTALCPSEPGGGTWIGLNDAGVCLALINWYSVRAAVAGPSVSRGEIVKSALPKDSPEAVEGFLRAAELTRVNPFRLIGVFPRSNEVCEWQWDLQQLRKLAHPWSTNTWSSSGFDEPGAQKTRGKVFADALRDADAESREWLLRLHHSHAPERGAYSTCMHRDDAATVSYTEVEVNRDAGTMRYAPGPPCCEAFPSEFPLAIKP